METLIEFVLREWRVIRAAPLSFFVINVLMAILIFFAVEYHYAETISTQRERIALYQDKLKVGSPEEAEKQFTALWNSLNGMTRRVNELEATGSLPQTKLDALPEGTFPVWVRFAYGEIGQAEIFGPKNNPRIVSYMRSIGEPEDFQDDRDDWSSGFAEWALNGVGINGPKNNNPIAWANWGTKLEKPVRGCVVIFSFDGLKHVAFYIEDDGEGFIKVLGGNQSDAVKISRYAKKDVIAYRMPPQN